MTTARACTRPAAYSLTLSLSLFAASLPALLSAPAWASGEGEKNAKVTATPAPSPVSGAAGEVNIYSYREPGLIQPLMDAFSKKTGIKTNVVYAKDGLIERIKAEGANSPADVLLAVDIGRLTEAKESGITQTIKTEEVDEHIPAAYRDPDGAWVGLSQRARVVFASKERVKQDSITYAELADPKWKGKICMRSGQHTYNVGLLAAIIAHDGEEKAAKWAEGVKNNLARKPAGGDRDQVKAIYAGECDIAVGNTYYMAAMETSDKPEQQEWAKSVKLLFPDSAGNGTHVNISGAVLAKNAPHKDAGMQLIDYLASPEAQKIYAEQVNEYPLDPAVAVSERVKAWGTLKPDALPLLDVAKNRKAASEIMDKVGFDQGPGA
ncbi:MAG: Fe(3+) ABC transporter substrate-binding protein [Hyphomicrobiaceae bacterium]|nr:Fe(3+) ABC transporter substrate-binding protein [Hyphomicrobiaceae bacterium]MCC0006540.1 Fe(3+) ABC transporter substrate-binding protein [Hyphomicrobiaceae bacterium]